MPGAAAARVLRPDVADHLGAQLDGERRSSGCFGLRPVGEEEIAHTSEELGLLLDQRALRGLDPALRSMLVRIFDLRRRTARHVMSLRSDAATLRANMTIDEAVRIVADAGYSRYPVLDEQGKNVLGYLHLRDLFDVLSHRRRAAASPSCSASRSSRARTPRSSASASRCRRARCRWRSSRRPRASSWGS